MKLSTKGRYAVMAVVDLALYTDDKAERPIALNEIAERQEISLSYLEQLFAKLRRNGIVSSARGPGGGYKLARTADQIRIADVILAVDEPVRVTRCRPGSAGGCMSDKGRCLTHDLWEELGNQITMFLGSITLADVLAKRVVGKSGIFHSQAGGCSSGRACGGA